MKKILLLITMVFVMQGANGQNLLFDNQTGEVEYKGIGQRVKLGFRFQDIPRNMELKFVLTDPESLKGGLKFGEEIKFVSKDTFIISNKRPNDFIEFELFFKNNISKPVDLVLNGYWTVKGKLHKVSKYIKIIDARIEDEEKTNVNTIQNVECENKHVKEILGLYNSILKEKLDCYVCSTDSIDDEHYAIQPAVFDSTLEIIYSNVILGNNDIIKTGSALSITQDKDKGVISYNHTFFRDNSDYIINIGLSAKSSSGLSNIYGPSSWSSDANFSLGISYILDGNSSYFNEDTCRAIKRMRRSVAPLYLDKYRRYVTMDLKKIKKEVDSLRQIINSNYDSLDKLITNKDDIKLLDSIINLKEAEIKKYFLYRVDIINVDEAKEKIENIVISDLEQFDYNKNSLYGYSVRWLDFKINSGFTSLLLETNRIESQRLKDMSIRNTFKAGVIFSFNWSHLGIRKLWYLQPQLGLELGSYLDYYTLTKSPYVQYDGSADQYYVYSGDNNDKLGIYKNLNNTVVSLIPGFYAGFFGGEKKNLGLDVRFTMRVASNKIDGSDLQNSYTLLVGPIVRVDGEKDYSKATFGLKFGLINALNRSQVFKEHFGVKAEIGVPFKWLFK